MAGLCLAGCTFPTSETDSPSSTTPETGTESPDVTSSHDSSFESRTVTLNGVTSDLSEKFDITPTVDITDTIVDRTSTAHVEITLRNADDRERTLSYLTQNCPTNEFSAVYRGEQRVQLTLNLKDVDFDREEDCWSPVSYYECGHPVSTLTQKIPGGERITWGFRLWHITGPCMLPGEYEFVRIFGSERSGDDLEGYELEGETAELSFTFLVESPG